MILKKLLSCAAAVAIAVSSLSCAVTGFAVYTIDNCFTYKYNTSKSIYQATFDKTNYVSVLNELGKTEIVMPETYNDGSNGMHNVELSSTGFLTSTLRDDLVTKITFNSNVSSFATGSAFKGFSKLETVEFKYTGSGFRLSGSVFSTIPTSLKDIYIYAETVGTFSNLAFSGLGDISVKVHVANDRVKNDIITSTGIDNSKIVVDLGSGLPTPVVTFDIEKFETSIPYGTEGGFKPVVTVKVNDSPVEVKAEDVTYELFSDKNCTSSSKVTYSTTTRPGTYYLRATVPAVAEQYESGMSEPLEVTITEKYQSNKDNLQSIIDSAKVELAKTDVYTSVSLQQLQTAVTAAETVMKNLDATRTEISNAGLAIEEIMDNLVKISEILSEDDWREQIDRPYQSYRNTQPTNYTEDSFEAFSKAKEEFEELFSKGREGVTSEVILDAMAKLKDAFDNLVDRTEFDYTELENAIASAEIIVTDPDAESKYPADAFKALKDAYDAGKAILDDKESVNSQVTIYNTASEINRTLNAFAEAVYNELQDAISEAKKLKEELYTAESYAKVTTALEAAKGITLEESALADIVKAKEELAAAVEGLEIDPAIATGKEELSKAVEEAKAIDSSKFTAESYEQLTKAIEEAEKVITDKNSTKNDIDAAKAALEEAIEGLTEVPPSSDPTDPPITDKPSNGGTNNGGNTNVNKPNVIATTAAPKPSTNRVKAAKEKAEKAMKQAKITKLKVKSKSKKKITVTWKKVKKAKGYRVQVSTNKKFKKSKIIFDKHTKKKTLKIATKKIKSGKTYYVRVSAYTTYKDNKGKAQKVYSKWNTKLRKVKVK